MISQANLSHNLSNLSAGAKYAPDDQQNIEPNRKPDLSNDLIASTKDQNLSLLNVSDFQEKARFNNIDKHLAEKEIINDDDLADSQKMTKKYHDAFHVLDENDRDGELRTSPKNSYSIAADRRRAPYEDKEPGQKADSTEDCLFFVGGNKKKKLSIQSKAYQQIQKLFESDDDACEKSDDRLGL